MGQCLHEILTSNLQIFYKQGSSLCVKHLPLSDKYRSTHSVAVPQKGKGVKKHHNKLTEYHVSTVLLTYAHNQLSPHFHLN